MIARMSGSHGVVQTMNQGTVILLTLEIQDKENVYVCIIKFGTVRDSISDFVAMYSNTYLYFPI